MFQILSLDGGGIRGIYSAAILAAIESDLSTNVIDHFDLLAGTSTGGIIALGLGLGLRPKQILDFYLMEGPHIFRNSHKVRSLGRLFRSKFDDRSIVSALQRVFGEKRFGESSKRLVIPSYNLGEDDVYNFRTAHHARLKRDYQVSAWKVAQATSAAPTYFPACEAIDHLRLIDGGVWANNPTMVAYIEAVGTLEIPNDQIRILNLGTCGDIKVHKRSLDRGGMVQWRTAGLDMVLKAQSTSAINHVKFLVGQENLLRVDSPVPAGLFQLDGHQRADDLLGKAAHFSRTFLPEIEQKYMQHKATQFVPLYS